MRELPNKDSKAGEVPTKRQRRALGKIAQYLEFADFLALLMVAATAFTGFATWRTASIAHEFLTSSERPYVGVRSVQLDTSRPGDPRIEVVYENFGHILAENTRILRRLMIDGRAVDGETKTKDAGILSPEVPHYLALHIPNGSQSAIIAGRSQLRVEVAARYDRPGGGQLCYLERFVYVAPDKRFEVNGGSTRCAAQEDWSPTSTADLRSQFAGNGPRALVMRHQETAPCAQSAFLRKKQRRCSTS